MRSLIVCSLPPFPDLAALFTSGRVLQASICLRHPAAVLLSRRDRWTNLKLQRYCSISIVLRYTQDQIDRSLENIFDYFGNLAVTPAAKNSLRTVRCLSQRKRSVQPRSPPLRARSCRPCLAALRSLAQGPLGMARGTDDRHARLRTRQDRQDRRGVAQATHAGAVLRHPAAWNRAGIHRAVLERKARGTAQLCLLRCPVVLLADEVRFRYGMAELLGADPSGRRD